jgi:hypothetical protein
VALFRVRPDGRDGSTLHESTVPPEIEGENETDSLIVSSAALKPMYDNDEGGATRTVALSVAESSSLYSPSPTVAQTVNETLEEAVVGVPDMMPVDTFTERPAGREPLKLVFRIEY